MKFLIFDAGPLISLTMNGLLPILRKLKNEFNGEFVITPIVKKELVDKPMRIDKYKFEAVQIDDLLDKGILKLSSDFVSDSKLMNKTKDLMRKINSVFYTNEGKIELIHTGEASCLTFSELCGCENVIVVDERTVRMLVEFPENLKNLMERKLHTSIKIDNKILNMLKGFKFIRSAELLYIAYKKDLFELKKDKELLDAVLYAVKYSGTAVSSQEIEEIKRLAV